MPVIRIDCIDDSRLSPFRNLIDRPGKASPEGFVVEGRWVVERLLSSSFEVISVLVGANRHADWVSRIPATVEIYQISSDDLSQLVGFKFHRGVLAYARRQLIRTTPMPSQPRQELWIACPRLSTPQNLGSLVRSAVGLGAAGIILGSESTDPFSRISVRSSAGQIFQLPIVQPLDFRSELQRLRDHGYHWIVTGVPESGESGRGVSRCESREPIGGSAAQTGGVGKRGGRGKVAPRSARGYVPPDRACLLLGAEDFGLDEEWFEHADAHLYVPIRAEVDSLNVATAGAILMYELCRPSYGATREF